MLRILYISHVDYGFRFEQECLFLSFDSMTQKDETLKGLSDVGIVNQVNQSSSLQTEIRTSEKTLNYFS